VGVVSAEKYIFWQQNLWGVVSAEKYIFWQKNNTFLSSLVQVGRFLVSRTFLEEQTFFIGLDDSTRVWLKNGAAT
jgi:hypothetical protein